MSTIQKQKQKIEAEIRALEEMGGSFGGKAKHVRDSVFVHFPIIFALLTTFGLVATFYGFEKIIDEITFFANHPILVLLAGLLALAVTGRLYKKLN